MSNGIGGSIEDLKYNYTVDQIYLFYEKSKRVELSRDRMNAIVMAQSMFYASPSYDRSGAHKKQKAWEKFLDSLDFDAIEEKSKPTVNSFVKMFQSAGVPIKGPKKEEGES